jgi:hypothetical protein
LVEDKDTASLKILIHGKVRSLFLVTEAMFALEAGVDYAEHRIIQIPQSQTFERLSV